MSDVKTILTTEDELKAFDKNVEYIENDFVSNATLYISESKSVVITCTINPVKTDSSKWYLTADFNGRGVSTGTYYDMIQDRFDAGERQITIKMVHQKPRPEAECGPTIEYVLGIDRGPETIKTYRKYLANPKARRNSIALLMD